MNGTVEDGHSHLKIFKMEWSTQKMNGGIEELECQSRHGIYIVDSGRTPGFVGLDQNSSL